MQPAPDPPFERTVSERLAGELGRANSLLAEEATVPQSVVDLIESLGDGADRMSSADVAHVDQVFVTPAARELGFGDALLEAAVAAAREEGARVLEGHALPGDRDTKNLYERAGITARLITVSTAFG